MAEQQLVEESLKRPHPEGDSSLEPPLKKLKTEDTNVEAPKSELVTSLPSVPSQNQEVPQEVKEVKEELKEEQMTVEPKQQQQETVSSSNNNTQPTSLTTKESVENNSSSLNSSGAPREAKEVVNNRYLGLAHAGEYRDEYKSKLPVNHIILPNFATESFAEEVQSSLQQEDWFHKKNDKVLLETTEDLLESRESALRDLRQALRSDMFREFIRAITGLHDQISVGELVGLVYNKGGHSLCHNDLQGPRRLAFMWCLVPKDWSKEDAGAMAFYDYDKHGQPISPSPYLIHPTWNTAILFELNSTSHYQISEIMSDKEHLSIVAYFHSTTPINTPQLLSEPPLPKISPSGLPAGFNIKEWISPEHTTPTASRKYHTKFEKDGSIAITNFFSKEKYERIEAGLKSGHTQWTPIGPPHRRHYDTLGRWGNETEISDIAQVKLFLRSKAFINWVESITGLSVYEVLRGEVRRFKHKDYTLVADNDENITSEGLDVLVGFQDAEWTDEDGGYTTYLDSEDELLSLVPIRNTLCLVHRDVGCVRFVKYVNAGAPGTRYDITNTFILASKDDDEGDDYADQQDDDYQSDDFDVEDENENDDQDNRVQDMDEEEDSDSGGGYY
eukprot:TRINITY_DN3115_c1_g1_i1.p1 TRINITY_DN3115_c1_g1~~TRINITY_DN3115_c1_g1_i1.p1  ORF type:complete len:615 (-),score=184.85 TRINITY_DN3115_c1_g1_i1:200-2044(-)